MDRCRSSARTAACPDPATCPAASFRVYLDAPLPSIRRTTVTRSPSLRRAGHSTRGVRCTARHKGLEARAPRGPLGLQEEEAGHT